MTNRAELEVERERYRQALASDLKSLVRQLSSMPAVQRVILFGSYADGRADLFTDLDLLVIMDSPLDFVARTAKLTSQLQAEVALDLLVYTPAEMDRLADSPFLRRALTHGKVLYARNSTS